MNPPQFRRSTVGVVDMVDGQDVGDHGKVVEVRNRFSMVGAGRRSFKVGSKFERPFVKDTFTWKDPHTQLLSMNHWDTFRLLVHSLISDRRTIFQFTGSRFACVYVVVCFSCPSDRLCFHRPQLKMGLFSNCSSETSPSLGAFREVNTTRKYQTSMAPPKKTGHQRSSSNPFKNSSNKVPDPDEEVGNTMDISDLKLP